jgi:hypothetical protein
MGEAKRRGTFAERRDSAVVREKLAMLERRRMAEEREKLMSQRRPVDDGRKMSLTEALTEANAWVIKPMGEL